MTLANVHLLKAPVDSSSSVYATWHTLSVWTPLPPSCSPSLSCHHSFFPPASEAFFLQVPMPFLSSRVCRESTALAGSSPTASEWHTGTFSGPAQVRASPHALCFMPQPLSTDSAPASSTTGMSSSYFFHWRLLRYFFPTFRKRLNLPPSAISSQPLKWNTLHIKHSWPRTQIICVLHSRPSKSFPVSQNKIQPLWLNVIPAPAFPLVLSCIMSLPLHWPHQSLLTTA